MATANWGTTMRASASCARRHGEARRSLGQPPSEDRGKTVSFRPCWREGIAKTVWNRRSFFEPSGLSDGIGR